jgi:RHH-type rel operon transcriptional repressor/antitoxin RelB
MAERRRQTQAVADRQSAYPLDGISDCRSFVLSHTPQRSKGSAGVRIALSYSATTADWIMRSTSLTVRAGSDAKRRLESLAKRTGRNRSFLAAEAINEYLAANEWQVAGIKQAIASLDRGEDVEHDRVKDWVSSWGSSKERPVPKP